MHYSSLPCGHVHFNKPTFLGKIPPYRNYYKNISCWQFTGASKETTEGKGTGGMSFCDAVGMCWGMIALIEREGQIQTADKNVVTHVSREAGEQEGSGFKGTDWDEETTKKESSRQKTTLRRTSRNSKMSNEEW